MAYTLVYSGGTVVVPDGSTYSLANITLPGRNFSGYGQPVDQSLLSLAENFASSQDTGPSNPIQGQLWYRANAKVLSYNTSATSTPTWVDVPAQSPNANVTFGNGTFAGNVSAANFNGGNFSGNVATFSTVNADNFNGGNFSGNGSRLFSLTGANVLGFVPNANVANTALAFSGTAGSAYTVVNAAQPNITSTGTLTSLTVSGLANLQGTLQTTIITTGALSAAGNITGNWTLTTGSRLNATYADFAERHESDKEYGIGTVMTVGGTNEVTAAQVGSKVLGVVSDQFAYLMNADAGPQETHPAIAYVGRLPVRVVGPISKHDMISVASNGTAQAASSGTTFGWALETNMDEAEKLVLCVIK